VLILGGAVLYLVLAGSLAMQPLLVSKINTTAQLILVAAHLARLGLGFDDFGVITVMTYVVAATTFVSGAVYFGIWSWRIVRMGSMR
jgi:cardiolipin synthase